jgi:hypothetical protein
MIAELGLVSDEEEEEETKAGDGGRQRSPCF